MGVRLQAPQGLIELPNPLEEDNDGLEAAVQIHKSITNIPRVYVRARGFQRFVYTFRLSIPLAEQLKNFLQDHLNSWMILTDYRDNNWRCLITSNPVEFVEHKRYRVSVTLDILGVKL